MFGNRVSHSDLKRSTPVSRRRKAVLRRRPTVSPVLTSRDLGSPKQVGSVLDVRLELGLAFHTALGYRVLVPVSLVALFVVEAQFASFPLLLLLLGDLLLDADLLLGRQGYDRLGFWLTVLLLPVVLHFFLDVLVVKLLAACCAQLRHRRLLDRLVVVFCVAPTHIPHQENRRNRTARERSNMMRVPDSRVRKIPRRKHWSTTIGILAISSFRWSASFELTPVTHIARREIVCVIW
ncbi:hypothetical protein BCV70DRAFT_125763 [Testicularia cyperi]|uniref:Uncharacterized protein n=1 Tax=Testicularia cyperi TaxID=1882483 RepID=A0A317XLH0_9BASI|nr:hypothetical protein BCV70DRAFT_125763 [Testicularia cyperi]